MSSPRRFLLPIAAFYLLGWQIQFVGHQMCEYFPFLAHNQPWGGWALVGGLIGLALPAFALIWFSQRRPTSSSPTLGWSGVDCSALGVLVLIGIAMWFVFARPAIDFPRHVLGDESFHSPRAKMMDDDARALGEMIAGKRQALPIHDAHTVFYPALADVPNAIISFLLGDDGSISKQRTALLPHFLLVPVALFLLSRILVGDRRTSICLALSPRRRRCCSATR